MPPRFATIVTLAAFVALFAVPTPSQSWQLATPANSPSARDGHSMAWDSARQRTVVFGGDNWAANRYFQEHWEYDGATWTQRTPAIVPPARTRAGMCYDERRGVIVLFGGMRDGTFIPATYFGDTWEFDGTTWTQVTPVGPTPSPRISELAYDSVRGKVVMFGGYGDTAPNLHSDTWEYNGVSWTQRTSAATPPARFDYTAAFDRQRSKLVIHPGYIAGNSTQLETWEWDGANWAQSANVTQPYPYGRQAMTYDARREVVVLVGAVSGGGTGTWEFDGVDWQLTAATRNEIGLSGHKLVYDAARGAVVSFGGEKVSGMFIVSTNETWEYAILAEFAPFGSSCAASGRIPKLAVQPYSAPRSGKTMFAEVSNLSAGAQPIMVVGFDNQTWNGVSLPLGLNALGLPACQLLISADAAFFLANQAGTAQWSLAIPANPQLHGFTFYGQALVVGPTLQPQSVTNGAALTIGR